MLKVKCFLFQELNVTFFSSVSNVSVQNMLVYGGKTHFSGGL